jgi:polar amino acid transport system substrate-binding protein
MMDDERVERALRAGPPDEPDFQPSGRWLQTADQDIERVRTSTRRLRFEPAGLVAVVAVAAAVFLIVILGGPLLELRERGAGGLVSEVERRGAVRVAVDGGPPQVFTTTGGYDGFDVDIARAVADRLGVRLEIVVVPRAEILAADTRARWDVAISSVPASANLDAAARTTQPYAVVSGAVAVQLEGEATDLPDLEGGTLCVVAGSSAESWATEELGPDGVLEMRPVPQTANVLVHSTSEQCIAALRDGEARGMVTDRRSDLAGVSGVRLLGSPPFIVPLVAVVDGRVDGYATLVARLNGLFAEMAADGTIRDLSQRRFAGDDVTP